jgi:hypothetical protein
MSQIASLRIQNATPAIRPHASAQRLLVRSTAASAHTTASVARQPASACSHKTSA